MLKINRITPWTNEKDQNGRLEVFMRIDVDEVSELPSPDSLDGYLLSMGSMAYVITTGESYLLNSDGVWCKSFSAKNDPVSRDAVKCIAAKSEEAYKELRQIEERYHGR